MNTELVRKYRNTDTEELIKIAFIDKDDYQTEAVEMATKELLSRGITSESEIVLQKTQKKIKEIGIRDTAPLETKSKVIFFICGMFFVPFFIAICFIELQKNKRGIRKTKESWKWLWIGLGTMVVLHAIVLLLITIIL